MKTVVFHGSPRKGNTYKATRIFLDALSQCGDVQLVQFFLPESMPIFCTGCQRCLGNTHDKCPHSQYVTPIFEAIMDADALMFTTQHHGACSMSACMKNLLDHLDFLTMNIAPRPEVFGKKAFILTTAAGSNAAMKPIEKYLRNWGINRVSSIGLKLFTDQWGKMTAKKKAQYEKRLRQAAKRFYNLPRKRPYLQTVFMYYLFKMIIRKYVGKDAYPYKHWQANGYFTKRPF